MQDRCNQVADSRERVFIPAEEVLERQNHESQIGNDYHDQTAFDVLAVHSVVFEVAHCCLLRLVSMYNYHFTGLFIEMWYSPQIADWFVE